MDAFIYALVMIPALKDLLPASGIPATAQNTGFYGGLLFAIFLVGWGFAFLWGPLADKFGRVKTLMFTILCLHFSAALRTRYGSWRHFASSPVRALGANGRWAGFWWRKSGQKADG